MKLELILTFAGWAATAILLVLFIPRNKIRDAALIYLFKLFLTWLLGLTVVQLGLIAYPERLFAKATNTSFSFEYFIYPSICAVFNLHYPGHKSKFLQFLYYSLFCTVMTVIEVLVERHTNIIKYIHWSGFMTWITLFVTFFLSRQFYMWFFKLKKKEKNPQQQSLIP